VSGTHQSSVRVLVVAMVLVAAGFVAVIAYFQYAGMQVQRETEAMLTNGVPSADQLALVRSSLRRLDASLDAALFELMEKHAFRRVTVDRARRRLQQELETYRRLPYYEGEAALNTELDEALRRLDTVVDQMIALLEKGNLQEGDELDNGAYRAESDLVDGSLRQLEEFNVSHATAHAMEIDRIRQRTWLMGLALAGFNIVLALAATVIAARAVRRQVGLQEERAAELEMFAARVAHDLMSPLAAVSLALEVNRRDPSSPNAAKLHTGALATLRRVRQIVDGLLDFARAGGQPILDARAPVGDVVAGVLDEVRPQAEEESIEVTSLPVPPCTVGCSPGVLAVILTNLVRNSIKYMSDAETRRVSLRVSAVAKLVHFEIEDTGPGLAFGLEHKVFEPYVRGDQAVPGLGLGLATVKRLVVAHGGRVGVQRADGGGARFWFELPRIA
jgi:signal transduction histidine kinase